MLEGFSVLIIIVISNNILDFHVFCLKDRTALILTMRNMLELMAYVTSLPQTEKKQTLNGSVTLKYNTPSRWRVTLSIKIEKEKCKYYIAYIVGGMDKIHHHHHWPLRQVVHSAVQQDPSNSIHCIFLLFWTTKVFFYRKAGQAYPYNILLMNIIDHLKN